MDIYHYHPFTGAFLASGQADPDPLTPGAFLIPAHATPAAPPSAPEGYVAVFANGGWSLSPDHRGEAWWDAEGAEVVVDFLGDPSEQGLSHEAPIPPPAPPLYLDAAAASAAMVAWIDAFTASITRNVPVDEKLSWPTKGPSAKAYLAGTADADQIADIEDEAAITGEVPADLAATIIANASLFNPVIRRVAGLRRKTQTAIDAVTDPADYETVLATAQDEAVALAASIGITI